MKTRYMYISYIIIGILYVLVKMLFISLGYLHPGAVLHGVIPAVLTILAGIFSISNNLSEIRKIRRQTIMLVLPVLVFIITPVYMYIKQGDQWLTHGRLEVLIIYEILALIQLAIVLVLIKRPIKSDEKK